MTSASVIARNARLQATAELLSKLLALGLYAVIARRLGERAFGDFIFGFSVATLVMTIAGAGIDGITTREVSRDRGTLARFLSDSLGIKTTLGLVATGVTIAVVAISGYPLEVQVAVALLALSMLCDLVAKTFASMFLALDDMEPVARGLLFQRIATAVLGIGVLLLGGGIVALSAVFLLAALLGLGVVATGLSGRAELSARAGSIAGMRALFRVSVPLGLSTVFTVVLFRVDTVLLSLYADSRVIGLYGAAYRLLDATLFVSFAFVSALVPAFARLAPTDRAGLSAVYAGAAKVLAVAMFPCAAVCMLWAAPILRLVYGSDFAAGAAALRWLAPTMALYGFAYLATNALTSQDRQRTIPWVTGLCALLNIGLNLLLIPTYSLVGCAVATTATEIVRVAVLTGAVTRMTGALPVVRILAGTLLGCGALALVRAVAGDALGWALVGGLAYLVVLVAFERARYPDDVRRVRAALARRQPLEAL